MMTRQMLLRGTALVLYLFPFRVILRKNKLLHPTWGLYIYTRHEQQSHGTVNFASELGVEKDREGEKWIQKNKKRRLVILDSTRLSIGHRGKRPPRCSFLSISRNTKKKKTMRKLKGGKKLEGFELKQKPKYIHNERYGRIDDEEKKDKKKTPKKIEKPSRLREGYICSGVRPLFSVFLFFLFSIYIFFGCCCCCVCVLLI